MPLSVQGYSGALYVKPADLTKLSPSRIQVLEEQGRARLAAENAAKNAEWEAHMKQKYGENYDWRKGRSRYDRFVDSAWEKLHETRRSQGDEENNVLTVGAMAWIMDNKRATMTQQ